MCVCVCDSVCVSVRAGVLGESGSLLCCLLLFQLGKRRRRVTRSLGVENRIGS